MTTVSTFLVRCAWAAAAALSMTVHAQPATQPGAPQFRDYPAEAPYTGPNHALVIDDEFSKNYRTRLREALANGKPEFAGRYIVARWGCGTGGCNVGAVIDASTGRATPLPGALMSVYPLKPEYAKEDGQELIYRLSSRLLIQAGDVDRDNGEDVVDFHEWRDGKFTLIKTLPYGRKQAKP